MSLTTAVLTAKFGLTGRLQELDQLVERFAAIGFAWVAEHRIHTRYYDQVIFVRVTFPSNASYTAAMAVLSSQEKYGVSNMPCLHVMLDRAITSFPRP